MSWPTPYLTALSAPTLTPYIELRFLSMPSSVNSSGVVFSNRTGTGHALIESFSSWSGSLTPSPCQISTGGFEVVLAGSLQGSLDDLHIGSLAVLYVHPTGDASAAEEWVCGPLESITRTGLAERFTLRFGDLLSALYSRQTNDAGTLSSSEDSEAALFWPLNVGAIVFSSGSSVDVSTSGQMTATSGAGDFDRFERESSQDGLLKVVNASSEETLLAWSSKASSTVLNMAGTGPQRNSDTLTWSTILGSNPGKVFPMVRLVGHPGVSFLKVLSSTGVTGLTGPYDTLPASWGIDPGGFLADLVDTADASAWIQEVIVTTTGSWTDYAWDIATDEAQDNGLSWLTEPMLQVGIFPVMRQGKLTLRALQDLNPATARQPHGLKTTGLTITDADIIEIIQYSFPSPDQQGVSRYAHVITAEVYGSSTPEREGDPQYFEDSYSGWDAALLPANVKQEHDLSAVLFDNGHLQQAAEGDAARLLCWDALPWERLSLKVHARFAQVCKGDVVMLTTEKVYGAFTETSSGYSAQPMLVVSVRSALLPPEGPAAWLELVTVTIPPET